MTVIAWDGKTLAADKRGSASGSIYRVRKIRRVGDVLIGLSGTAAHFGAFVAWWESGRDPAKYPKNEENNSWCVIVVHRDGTLHRYEFTPYPIVMEESFIALGSGKDFATATMHLGFDAVRAVEVASLYDDGCGNGVDTLSFDK